MSRKPLPPPISESDRRANRMALGGRLKTESRVDPFWRPVGMFGMPGAWVKYYAGRAVPPYTGEWCKPGDLLHPSAPDFYWILWPSTSAYGGIQPPNGYYNVTFNLTLTGVHPAETTLDIDVETWTYMTGEPPVYTVSGGPFTVGQVIRFTIYGGVDGYDREANLNAPAPLTPVLWAVDCATAYFTVEPAPAP